MLFSNILVPFDGSELALKSLDKAIEFAKVDSSVKVNVLTVYTLPAKKHPESLFNQVKQLIIEEGHEKLDKAKDKLAEIPDQSQVFLKEGVPYHSILDEATALNCDLIIMGSRGLSGLKEFLGSVSHSITQKSQIPVLIMK